MSFAEGESKTGLTEEGMALPIAADAAEALDERSKSQDDYEEQEQDYQVRACAEGTRKGAVSFLS